MFFFFFCKLFIFFCYFFKFLIFCAFFVCMFLYQDRVFWSSAAFVCWCFCRWWVFLCFFCYRVVVALADSSDRHRGETSEREWGTAVDGWTKHRVLRRNCQKLESCCSWKLEEIEGGVVLGVASRAEWAETFVHFWGNDLRSQWWPALRRAR